MEQWTSSKFGKEYDNTVYCYPDYLTYMQSTSCKIPAGWITKWNQDHWKKYQQPQICRWCTLMAECEEELIKSVLLKVKEKREKPGLKLNIQKIKIRASCAINSWHIEREKVEAVTDFTFLGSKITVNSDCSH